MDASLLAKLPSIPSNGNQAGESQGFEATKMDTKTKCEELPLNICRIYHSYLICLLRIAISQFAIHSRICQRMGNPSAFQFHVFGPILI